MKVGLIDVDGHAKKKKWGATIYPNLALCKIASYHRSKGDEVEWYNPMFSGHMDKVYMANEKAALAEGVQVLAMLKKFRCLLESEGNDNEMRTL